MSSILDNKLNKDKCQKFTPSDIVENMLDLADYRSDLAGKKVLENSFGSGNIIIAVVKRYIEDSLSAGIMPEDISRNLESDIYGVELDKELFDACIHKLNLIVEAYSIPRVKWSLFNEDALFWQCPITFDFIIGNPPYITYKDIDEVNRRRIREKYESCKLGKFDYCYAFIERGIELLNSSGKLVQLVPANIYKNVFGEKLRELLYPHIRLIRDYPGQELFDKALTSSTIFLFDKSYESEVFTYVDMTISEKTDIARSALGNKWIFSSRTKDPQEKLRFGDYFHASIVVATLLNKAFVLSSKDFDGTNIEVQVVRKAASPKQLRRKVQEFIIFPYYYMNGELMHYDKTTFERNYPNAVQHLNNYKSELDERQKDSRAAWFEYGRSQALAHLKQKKLLMSTVVTKQVELYLLDEETIPYSGIFITVKKPEYSLNDAAKILQSNHFMEYVQSLGISVSGNSKRITCKDINNYMFVKE
ncbi:MAG: N-6 DNA methylase [Subdoligranulum sp.]|nr:N-6 DNA methylase [Subdoligranulum sp.]